VPVSGLQHSQTKRKSQVSEACRESSHKIQATLASIEFGFSLLRINECIGDYALVDMTRSSGRAPVIRNSEVLSKVATH
jgi:hypothetical protein